MVKLLGSLPATVATALLACGCTNDARDDTATSPAVPLDPISAILDAFDTHDVIALGDFHHDPQLHDLRMKLIADPRFPDIVRDVVFEFGTPQQQVLLDRYVSGDDVSSEELRASADGISLHSFWSTALFIVISSPPSRNVKHHAAAKTHAVCAWTTGADDGSRGGEAFGA